MGEGILIYGLGGKKRRFTRDLQSFADRVYKIGVAKGSIYRFGRINKTILEDLRKQGIEVKTDIAAITDKTLLKYRTHPKKGKGAVVDSKRFVMVEAAVKRPKNVYIDTNRNRLVYVSSVKYSPNKVLKVIVEPSQRIGKGYFNQVKSIGVVNKENMRTRQYKKIK